MSSPLRSFIEVPANSHFPIQNLPFGVFQPKQGKPRVGVAIGDLIVDLSVLEQFDHFRSQEFQDQKIFSEDSLNKFLALGRPAWRKTREILQHLLLAETPTLRDNARLREKVFHAQKDIVMKLPARIGNYTDFYSSYHHAHNVGTMLRGTENALMPNWKWLPVAYHGRASSVVVSGTDVRRPSGQTRPPDASAPVFGPSKSFDYELEMAFLIGPGNSLGKAVPIDRAIDHIFGFVLMNDWSARDIQAWEYQPLGPFLAKNFCTSIAQQLAHHTVNGCNLQPGDLLASGTISGPTEESRGCMLELTWRGANPLKLPNGETRKWLEDGDRLTITGWCQGDSYRVGFGEVNGQILPAVQVY